jgi:hypothetical protein
MEPDDDQVWPKHVARRKNEHFKNSGIVCVKVTMMTNIKITRQHTGLLYYRTELC